MPFRRLFRKKSHRGGEIEPDEIFLDAKNLPSFDIQQFEGRIEQPIPKYAVYFAALFFAALALVILGKAGLLQIVGGEAYAMRADQNTLKQTPVFSERGGIYDRRGVELAWDDNGRSYYREGLAHVLGYVGRPSEDELAELPDEASVYPEELIGKAGAEKVYQDILRGKPGMKIVETDAFGAIQSESVHNPAENGKNISLTIDARVNSKLFKAIKNVAEARGFTAGSGVIMDVATGELLALTSYPEYDPQVLSKGEDHKAIASYISDPKKPFLARAMNGVYAPGSIIKPFMALGVLTEHIIDPKKQILSTGSISIPNPFYPEERSTFLDWKAHGWVDMRRALAVSSNVYFYVTVGGFEGQRGLGVANIGNYTRAFGFGAKTGIDFSTEEEGTIPSPAWKAREFQGEPWRIGDTYNTAIGQYGFQVTPLQIVRGIAAIANEGTLVTPSILHSIGNEPSPLPKTYPLPVKIDPASFAVVHEGMRMAVTEGTAAGLNVPGVKIAAKTGTAQLGTTKSYVNSWVTGFFPYEHPRFAFVVVMEHGPAKNTVGGLAAARELVDWMSAVTPEYID